MLVDQNPLQDLYLSKILLMENQIKLIKKELPKFVHHGKFTNLTLPMTPRILETLKRSIREQSYRVQLQQ